MKLLLILSDAKFSGAILFRVGASLLFLFFCSSAFSLDKVKEMGGGRWIPPGTFAYSNFPNNEERENTYSGSRTEGDRILSYLPGMTIIYNSVRSVGQPEYMEGITHSGIPVKVLERDLSDGVFNDRTEKDVVVHRSHFGCRNLACDGDQFEVGVGSVFKIKFEDNERIELVNMNELEVVYSRRKFNKYERSGVLTRHKGRKSPRWSIYDGYAHLVSLGCNGEVESDDFEVEVSIEDYEEQPSEWSMNDKRWSLKAIEIFGLGEVEESFDDENTLVGTLDVRSSLYKGLEKENAFDLTVFAYRDRSWDLGYFRFAGLIQVVSCERSPMWGGGRPTFVRDVHIYFDKAEDDDYEQSYPLSYQALPSQLSEKAQKKIYGYINRSFFYSINSPQDYESVFEMLSDIIPVPTAVSNVIARLNGSCEAEDRKACRNHYTSQRFPEAKQ